VCTGKKRVIIITRFIIKEMSHLPILQERRYINMIIADILIAATINFAR